MLDEFSETARTRHLEPDIAIDVHATLGRVYTTIQYHDDACEHYQRACELSQRYEEDPLKHAARLFRWGNYMFLATQDQRAIEIMQEALAIYDDQSAAPTSTCVSIRTRLGYSLTQLRRFDEAREYLIDALSLFESLNAEKRLSWRGHTPYLYLGNLHKRCDDLPKALQFHELAVKHARLQDSGRAYDALAWALRALAGTQRQSGDLDAATRSIEEAITIYRQYPNQRLRHCLAEYVRIAQARGESDQLMEACRYRGISSRNLVGSLM